MNDYVDTMTRHYAIAALWSSYNEDGIPLDANFEIDDIHPDTYREMREDCARFVRAGDELIGDMSPDQCGHDFWLTRDGHGVGFWDRGLGDRGDRLTEISEGFGEVDLYIGDDRLIHA